MQFFHIFMLTYSLNGYPVEGKLYLENSKQCQVAIRANEQLVEILGANAFCVNTGILSSSIRPRLRPSAQSVDRQ